MRVVFNLLLLIACVLADKNEDRRSKLPFVADAVGNALPPPSSVPAPVGSPVNLLTPDRYEFYTFDESGELVKRLMTLEEIQAIVAAGEEGDSMVTFANDDQPTVAFNFSQPPSTKVHSVVTNVQNVLKAQMEAHKNKPLVQPTLDTPDVSDSWSLILPSIFGNTGVDIVPDKSSGSFTTPETETLEIDINKDIEADSLSKEGNQHISNTTISQGEMKDAITERPATDINESKDKFIAVSEISSTSIPIPTTTFTSSTTEIPENTSVSTVVTTVSSTIATHRTTTTIKPPSTTTKTSTTTKPTTTTLIPTTTTVIPTTIFKIIETKSTTFKPELSTQKYISVVESNTGKVENDISDTAMSSEKDTVFEKISTFIPVSTVKYVTERTTDEPSTTKVSTLTTKIPTTISIIHNTPTITNMNISTLSSFPTKESELEKNNITTITTQSVSPSTTVSSTEVIAAENIDLFENVMENSPVNDNDTSSKIKDNEPLIPLFDVAQSISQIASDLGGDFRPLPTVSNILDTTQVLEENFESKENNDMEISTSDDAKSKIKNENSNEDNFVKISTLDPHPEKEKLNVKDIIKQNKIKITSEKPIEIETTTILIESTTMDPILNESMDDLISQVVNEIPQHFADSESSHNITTEYFSEIVTENNINVETTELQSETEKDTIVTTEKMFDESFNTYTTLVNNEITTEAPLTVNKEVEDLLPSKNDIDNNNLNEYIQIFVSGNESGLETTTDIFEENEFITDIPPNKQNIENDNVKTTQENILNGNDIPNLETTTIKLELIKTTPIPGNIRDIPSLTLGKVNSVKKIISNKKEANTNKQNNIQNLTPKTDELKKKIQKVNIAEEELINNPNNSWKLISTVSQSKDHDIVKDKVKADNHYIPDHTDNKDIILEFSKENQGLEVTTKDLSEDVAQFTELCNELAFRYWNVMTENVDKKRSFVLSPYSITSMLAMMFMGARGATSGEMNEILKLDDMVTFNPHFTLKNISDSIDMNQDSGIIVSAFIRELYSDRNKGKILTFYKERAQHFYNGHVEEINFKLISDIIRRRTNLLVKRYTWGKIPEYMKTNTIVMQPPLAAFSANIFQTDCTGSSVGGRDGEMYFVVSPNVRQRRLVPVPAVVYKNGFLAGYDPVLDATAAALGNTTSIVSTLFVMPGQQGNVVHAEDLEKLEQRLLEANPTTPAWNRLLRTLLPRIGLELQIPRFSHKSVFNVSSSLRKMGLKDLFDAEHADLGGLNGPSKDLYLSDMVQMTSFVTCGEDVIGEQHHVEDYPESLPAQRRRTSRWTNYWDEPRDYQRAFHDPHDVGEAMNLPLHLRPRQARVPSRNVQPARLKFDRPFLFFTRHNPTGMILYVGRYNPRLLP